MIGGNITITINCLANSIKSPIGEKIAEYEHCITLSGFLDMLAGDNKRSTYNTKIEESTHVFVCDYNSEVESIRMKNDLIGVINNRNYKITFIDNPMELNQHLEIYLKLYVV